MKPTTRNSQREEAQTPTAPLKIKATYEYFWEATFEISDVSKAAKACLESLMFFGDPITREDESDMETIHACLRFWLPTIISESMHWPQSLLVERMADQEGCIPFDGSQGLKLIDSDSWAFDRQDFEIKVEVTA